MFPKSKRQLRRNGENDSFSSEKSATARTRVERRMVAITADLKTKDLALEHGPLRCTAFIRFRGAQALKDRLAIQRLRVRGRPAQAHQTEDFAHDIEGVAGVTPPMARIEKLLLLESNSHLLQRFSGFGSAREPYFRRITLAIEFGRL